jgi:hypothetical protein
MLKKTLLVLVMLIKNLVEISFSSLESRLALLQVTQELDVSIFDRPFILAGLAEVQVL